MAQTPPEYSALDEFMDLAKQLVEKHSEKFYGIDLEVVAARQITNKDRGEKNNKLYEVMAVKPPVREDCKYAFYIIIHQSDWNILEKKHKLLLIAQSLHSISLDENGDMEEGKLNAPDMKDFSSMLRTFGPDYLVKDNVPDLLDDEVKWIE
jgi:hypothetical protein